MILVKYLNKLNRIFIYYLIVINGVIIKIKYFCNLDVYIFLKSFKYLFVLYVLRLYYCCKEF